MSINLLDLFLGPGWVAANIAYDRTIAAPVDDSDDPQDVYRAKKFLAAEAMILGSVVAAPAIYKLATGSKKRKSARTKKREEAIATELSHASTRASTMLAAFGPAFAIPATYITVQGLENAKYISKGLGDAVQGLLTASAAAGLVGGAVGAALPFLKK